MWFGSDEFENVLANARFPYVLERSALAGDAIGGEFQNSDPLIRSQDREHLATDAGVGRKLGSMSADAGSAPPTTQAQDDIASYSSENATDVTGEQRIGDAATGDSAVEKGDTNPQTPSFAAAAAAGAIGDAPFDVNGAFESLLGSKVVVLDGAAQVWSDLASPIEMESTFEPSADAGGGTATDILAGLEPAFAGLNAVVLGDNSNRDEDDHPIRQLVDAPETVASHEDEIVLSALELDIPFDHSLSRSQSTEMPIDQSVDLQPVADGVPQSDNLVTVEPVAVDVAAPPSGAYFIDVMAAVRPGMSSVEFMQTLYVGQEHHG